MKSYISAAKEGERGWTYECSIYSVLLKTHCLVLRYITKDCFSNKDNLFILFPYLRFSNIQNSICLTSCYPARANNIHESEMDCFDPNVGGSATKEHTDIQVPISLQKEQVSLRTLPLISTLRQGIWINESK